MLISELKSFLSKMYNNTEKAKTVLIEGKWGCGKTYTIRDYLKNRKRPANVIYLSLFGLCSSEEILLHLAEQLDSSAIASFGHSFVVRPSLEQKPYNETLIIFDDLERIDEKLNYSTVYGIVDSLMMLGFKVLCVSCERKDGARKEYSLFKEKTFDLSFVVEPDKKTCEKMLGGEIIVTDSILESANNNLRSLKRAKHCFDALLEQIKIRKMESFFKQLAISKNDYFEYIVLAERCYYSSNTNDPIFDNENNEFAQIHYNEDVLRFDGTLIANEIYELKSRRTDLSMDRVRDLIDYLRTSDFDLYFSHYYNVQKDTIFDKNPILRSEPFLLDDDEKERYAETFLSTIDYLDFDNPSHRNALMTFLKSSINKISESTKEKLLDALTKKVSKEAENEIIDYGHFVPDNKELHTFLQTLRYRLDNKRTLNKIKEMSESISKSDYAQLLLFLRNSKYSTDYSQVSLLKALQDKGFGLPDLSETLDYSAWTYCHEMAKLVSGSDYEKSFVEALEKQCNNHPSSVSVRERCNALVRYNLKEKYEDFFKKCPLLVARAKVKI